jgi:hypothetical protein
MALPLGLTVLVVSAVLAGCGSTPELPRNIPGPGVLVAQAHVPQLDVYDHPDDPQPSGHVTSPGGQGAPIVGIVDRTSGDWVLLELPQPPPGSTGWVRAADVDQSGNPYRIVVTLHTHHIDVIGPTGSILSAPVGVGRTATPPPGHYFIAQLLQPQDPQGPYGPNAYGFSGFTSDVLAAGADGVTGLSGTDDPQAVGQDNPNGTIRLRNEDVKRLVPVLPLGTPVAVDR